MRVLEFVGSVVGFGRRSKKSLRSYAENGLKSIMDVSKFLSVPASVSVQVSLFQLIFMHIFFITCSNDDRTDEL